MASEERLTTDIYPADFSWTPDWTRPITGQAGIIPWIGAVHGEPTLRTNQIDYDEEVVHATSQAVRNRPR
jgi:choline-sulfatase